MVVALHVVIARLVVVARQNGKTEIDPTWKSKAEQQADSACHEEDSGVPYCNLNPINSQTRNTSVTCHSKICPNYIL